MELYLKHGRSKLAEDMSDWGPEGPRLQSVTGIHQTYNMPANVFFDTPGRFSGGTTSDGLAPVGG